MGKRKPQVGDWADHKSGVLDPRMIAVVSKGGKKIKLQLSDTYVMKAWVPAKYYHIHGPRQ